MRLFFALWPDAEVVGQVRRAIAEQWGERPPGRVVAADNLHITLAFLGAVAPETALCLREAAARVAFRPFRLDLDHSGHWPRPRVAWLGCQTTPSALAELVAGLNLALAGCGLEPEPRPFHPHLTVLRKVRTAPVGPLPPIPWPVAEFVLAESVSSPAGVHYRILGRWPAATAEGWDSAPQL